MPRAYSNKRWWTAEKVAAMHAEYLAGARFIELAQRWGGSARSVRKAFEIRGLKLLDRAAMGRFQTTRPLLTDAQAVALIDELQAVRVPEALHHTWRKWSWQKRGWWLQLAMQKRPAHKRMPTGPCSPGIVPFHYCTPEARAIVELMNAGKDSRSAGIKMNLCSEGLIFEGKLWFWSWKLGRYTAKSCQNYSGRRDCLHWHLYERHHGPVPPGMVVRHADRNPNNFDPANLVLQTRDALVRENQASMLHRRAKLHTAALLRRHNPTLPTP